MLTLTVFALVIIPFALLLSVPLREGNLVRQEYSTTRGLPLAVGKGINAERWIHSAEEQLRHYYDAA